jgi:hypothetical protein
LYTVTVGLPAAAAGVRSRPTSPTAMNPLREIRSELIDGRIHDMLSTLPLNPKENIYE